LLIFEDLKNLTPLGLPKLPKNLLLF
jgi:hypothetical protein